MMHYNLHAYLIELNKYIISAYNFDDHEGLRIILISNGVLTLKFLLDSVNERGRPWDLAGAELRRVYRTYFSKYRASTYF